MKLSWLRYGNCLIGLVLIATALLLQGRGGRIIVRVEQALLGTAPAL